MKEERRKGKAAESARRGSAQVHERSIARTREIRSDDVQRLVSRDPRIESGRGVGGLRVSVIRY